MAPKQKRRKLSELIHKATCLGNAKDIEVLMGACKTDPSAINEERCGTIPLLSAIRLGHIDCVAALISCGADVNVCLERWLTPVTCAIDEENEEVLQMLLAAGANINPSQITVSHPLYVAIGLKNNTFVELLLQKGANPHLKIFNKSFMKYAVALEAPDIVRTLLKYGVSLTDYRNSEDNELLLLMSMSILKNNVECIKALLLYDAITIINRVIQQYGRVNTCLLLRYLTYMIINSDNVTEGRIEIVDILRQFGFNFWAYETHNENGYGKIDISGPGWQTIEHIKQVRRQPLSLKSLSRLAIQRHLGPRYLQAIPQLELPSPLYPFLKHEDT